MSNVYVVSIGLNVGEREPAAQLSTTLGAAALAFGPLLSVAMGASEWEGVPERFVQCAVLCSKAAIESGARTLAAHLRQECIAYARPDAECWALAYPDQRGIMEGGAVADFPIIAAYPSEE